jgi:hypothetical protein
MYGDYTFRLGNVKTTYNTSDIQNNQMQFLVCADILLTCGEVILKPKKLGRRRDMFNEPVVRCLGTKDLDTHNDPSNSVKQRSRQADNHAAVNGT